MRKYAKIVGIYLLIIMLHISYISSGWTVYAENQEAISFLKMDDVAALTQNNAKIIANALVTPDSANVEQNDTASPTSVTMSNNVLSVFGEFLTSTPSYKIKWTTVINSSKLSTAYLNIAVDLPAGWVFVPGSTQLGTSAVSPTITGTSSAGQDLVINLGNLNDEVIFTYETTMDPAFMQNGDYKFTNKTTLNGTETVTADVDVARQSLTVSGAGYNRANGVISWGMTINNENINLAAPTITTTIPSDQKYIQGSAKIVDNQGNIYSGGVFDYDTVTSKLSYKFNSVINSTYTITYDTKPSYTNAITANQEGTFTNTATFTSGTINVNSTGSQGYTSNVFKMHPTGYDLATRTITWKFIVNENGATTPSSNLTVTDPILYDAISLGNIQISDVLPAGLEFVPNSEVVLDTNNNPVTGLVSVTGTNNPTFRFNSSITEQYSITFETKITDDAIFISQNNTWNNGNFDISNKATLTHDKTTSLVEGSANQEIKNQIISKKGNPTTMGNKYVDWAVYLNSNAVNLNRLLDVDKLWLIDQLPAGLELDTSSVALIAYDRAILVPDQMPTSGADGLGAGRTISLDGTHIKYDAATREFRFNIPNDTIETAYKLTFRTYVTEDVVTGSSFPNTIKLFASKAGTSVGIENAYQSSDTRQVSFTETGNMGYGNLGNFVVKKVDVNNPNNKLSGAKFALYDRFGNKLQEKMTVDGALEFHRIQLDVPYYIKELEAPTGYLWSGAATVDNNSVTFTPAGYVVEDAVEVQLNTVANQKSKEVLFNSQESKTTVQFVKQDEANKPLAGAQFGLFPRGASASTAPLATATSSSLGNVSFTNITHGAYDIREISAPAGYLTLTDVVHAVDIVAANEDKTTTLGTVTNEWIQSTIEFVKHNDKLQPLADATFGLYDSQNVEIQQVTTGVDGIVQFTNIGEDSYTIKEITAPTGYEPINGVVYNVTITGDDHKKTKQLNPVVNTRVPAPTPAPKPEPTPAPKPEPTPAPKPEPTLAPEPTPGGNGAITPDPTPIMPEPEQPGPTKPVPVPEEPKPTITFSDTSTSWAKAMIEAIAARGIITGYPDGTFRPNEPIKREHMAIMLARAFELMPKREAVMFSDVPTSHLYYEAITVIQQAGFVDGSNGAFNPNESLTRAQLAKILVLALGLTPGGTSKFQDVPTTHWSYDYIATLADHGIALGDNGNFKPNEPVTRAQFAAFLYRALNL